MSLTVTVGTKASTPRAPRSGAGFGVAHGLEVFLSFRYQILLRMLVEGSPVSILASPSQQSSNLMPFHRGHTDLYRGV